MRRNDPYRTARKTHSPAGSCESNQLKSVDAHSRSASDSSTTKLTSSNHDRPDYYTDDPYARHHRTDSTPSHPLPNVTSLGDTNNMAQIQDDQFQPRTHSYLPYSNHQPTQRLYQTPSSSLALDDSGRLHSFSTPDGKPVGSLLQDNFTMDMVDTPIRQQRKEELPAIDLAVPKSRHHRCLGLGRKGKLLVFAFFVIVVLILLLYFVCPRALNVSVVQGTLFSSNTGSNNTLTSPNNASTGYSNNWNISVSIDNTANWVPIHINQLDLFVYDASTGIGIGNGSTSALQLNPKSQSLIFINTTIDYHSSNPSDPTLVDIGEACTSAQITTGTPHAFDLLFVFTYRLRTLAWSLSTSVRPSDFICPDQNI
ncbi:hypothetical protein DM01DRAFT_1405835 [Hesseltinella vesiculosa]|uniref:Late embryogenesis abundant protein LEA-2 subgroup domain-containing protein n=1 Tax=Hesseltinella vesiculosa TaxID=101127 RepID=A0A1X2GP78_9FUNG|nr:hypothetical protein DM01DRAFT_1405835 [Hesseltinella vesiculosa]